MSYSNPDSKAAQLRATDRAHVVAIDTQIHELQERIRVLQTEREPCQQRLDAYRYPVLTLPNEITSGIFLHFIPPYPACPPLRGIASPTSLTHICRKWREIALTSPRLWRAFCTGYTAHHLAPSPHAPIYWQHVQLDLAADDVALINGPMPLLESLCLDVDFDYTHPATTARDFPRLRSVALYGGIHGNWLPISQLTSLTFQDVEPTNYYLPILQEAVNLVRLHLIDCDTDVPPQTNVKLDQLQTLVLVRPYEDVEGAACQIVMKPALAD
ncbi:hypothetical protein FB45DRAFT_1021963 [Roridomyces roridus]|uniref:F-box domain-containing protein n=1 Tax=Roridomyces roridus TaxID=1738132 RepID=A0AAD7FWD6_9AGAR|nr:hypothetical protein FB45DRAFT_1021963 [Roridomyces roridus]